MNNPVMLGQFKRGKSTLPQELGWHVRDRGHLDATGFDGMRAAVLKVLEA